MLDRVYITGASGCGVTTLGKALAAALGAVAIDTDDHYWVPTDPPYREKRPPEERVRRIAALQAAAGRWVVSGTAESWGEPLVLGAELIVFLEAPTPVRIERLRRRERERFGDRLLPGGALHDTHREFIAWAGQYEEGREPGRSRPRHEKWLARVSLPVLRLDSTRPVEALVEAVLEWGASGGAEG